MSGSSQVRIAGWLVFVTAFSSAVLMLHHPTGNDVEPITQVVHGGLIAILLLQFAAVITVMRSFGWSLVILIAATFFAAGQGAGVLAGTINGFVAPAIGSYPAGEIGHDIERFAWEQNQAFARLGVVAVGLAFAAFAIALWQRGMRVLALGGWIAGLVPAALIVSGAIGMDLHGALIAYLSQAAFLLALGIVIARRRDAEEPVGDSLA